MTFTEQNKIVTALSPIDNTGAAATVCDIVGMKGYDHATFIISFGVVHDSMTGTLIAYKGEDFTTCTTAFACKYRYGATMGAGASDTLATLTTLATTGVSLATGEAADVIAAPCTIVVEIDAADLAPTVANPYDTVRVGWTNSAHSTLVSIVCILSKGRYQDAAQPTAIV